MKRSLCVMAVALGGVMARGQLPEIYEIGPRSARAGEVLTIFGQNFDPVAKNNVVHIGGVHAHVRESWVTELEVEVPAAAQEGVVTLAAHGKLASSDFPFQPLFAPFGQSNAVYRRASIFPQFGGATSNLVSIATADLDGDGGPELLCETGDARIHVFEFDPGAPLLTRNSFLHRAQLLSSAGSTNLIVVDFDADGRIDIVTTGPNGFDLFRNIHEGGPLSDASFAPGSRLSRTGPQPLEWHLADINRDGRLDVITREATSVSFHLNTYDPNSTNRWLTPRSPLTPIFNTDLRDMAIGDLNHDGHVDVAIDTADAIRIFSHNSPSEETNLFTQIAIPLARVTSVQLSDVEGDGDLDVLTFNAATGAYVVLRNSNVGGHLATNDFERIVLAVQDIADLNPKILDVNGDGFADIVRGRSLRTSPGVYFENQSRFLQGVIFPGSFLSATNTLTNAPVLITADINRDGAQDVIALDRGVIVYQNVTTLRPELLGLAFDGPPGFFSIDVIGRPGDLVTLQSTSNFKTWSYVSTTRIGSGGVAGFSGDATNQWRFYRLQPAP